MNTIVFYKHFEETYNSPVHFRILISSFSSAEIFFYIRTAIENIITDVSTILSFLA